MDTVPIILTPTGALNIRSGPGIGHQVIGLVRPGDDLAILEPPKGAIAKLGQYGEWVNIRTPAGKKGYAAAWFLEVESTEFILTPTGNRLRVRETPVSGKQVASVNPAAINSAGVASVATEIIITPPVMKVAL